jgi:hypothetical protein
MRVPKSELPDVGAVFEMARQTLPEHYVLLDVRCDFGSSWPEMMPTDFDLVIEYEDGLDDAASGSPEAIEAHQAWANPLIATIRRDWPAHTIRVSFVQKTA